MIKKDFKQKYFLYCKDCKTEIIVKKYDEILAQLKDNSYICGGIIKIKEL